MADETTRRLLKVFGITVTDYEATSAKIHERARVLAEAGGHPAEFLSLFEELNHATTDLNDKWMEVTHHLREAEGRAYADLLHFLETVQGKEA